MSRAIESGAMNNATNTDSPLSITASVAGLLTLITALAGALYIRLKYLRDADTEFFQVKASLSWYKTESTFMKELISSSPSPNTSTLSFTNGNVAGHEHDPKSSRTKIEHEMYAFIIDQLGRLEERLLALLTEAEVAASRKQDEKEKKEGWTLVPSRLRGRTDIAICWLPVRAKALELVRQRDALGARVLFAQMSVVSSRVKDQELKAQKRDVVQRERMEKLEDIILAQGAKLDRMEDMYSKMVF